MHKIVVCPEANSLWGTVSTVSEESSGLTLRYKAHPEMDIDQAPLLGHYRHPGRL